jgi:chromosome segregation ATPase
MSTAPKDRPNIVNIEARRSERSSVEQERLELDVLRRGLERERAALADERTRLEQQRAEFEEDLGVLEDQRRFLDAQRESIRREAEALESEREAFGRARALATQRHHVESAIADARRTREDEKQRLRAEMSGLIAGLAQHAR